MSNVKNLAQKIAAASTAVGALATDAHNPQGNYPYISSNKILERAGNALADVGVAVVPGITHVEVNTGTTSAGKPRFDVTVYMKMIVTDGETDIETPWLGMGCDFSVPDKATFKAITSGHKYFLAKLLNIGAGNEDGEHEIAPDPAPVAKPQPARKQAKPANGQHPEESFDNPWSGDAPDKPKATPAQLAEIDELGQQVYGDQWGANISRLAQWASTGNASWLEDLLGTEAHKAIGGLKKKLPESEPA